MSKFRDCTAFHMLICFTDSESSCETKIASSLLIVAFHIDSLAYQKGKP